MRSGRRDEGHLLELLLDLGRDVQLLLRECCEGEGLGVAQWEALRQLNERGAIPLQDLASALRVTRSTISRVASQLEGHDLLERLKDPSDARISLVQASPAGLDACFAVEAELKRRLKLVGGHGARDSLDPALTELESLRNGLAAMNRRMVPAGGDRP